MFGPDELQQFVNLAGEALRDENAYVAGCLERCGPLYGTTCPPVLVQRELESELGPE